MANCKRCPYPESDFVHLVEDARKLTELLQAHVHPFEPEDAATAPMLEREIDEARADTIDRERNARVAGWSVQVGHEGEGPPLTPAEIMGAPVAQSGAGGGYMGYEQPDDRPAAGQVGAEKWLKGRLFRDAEKTQILEPPFDMSKQMLTTIGRLVEMMEAYAAHVTKGLQTQLRAALKAGDDNHAKFVDADKAAIEAEARNLELMGELERARTDRNNLMSALGWRIEAPVDELILGDARLLRPEMAKARTQVQELQSSAEWANFLADDKPKDFAVKMFNSFKEQKKRAESAESRLAEAEKALEELRAKNEA